MVRRRRWIRYAEAQYQTRGGAETVLAARSAKRGARKGGHEVIQLGHAPGDVLCQDHVHAAASCNRECILLATTTGDLAIASRTAEYKFAKRNKIIKLAQ